LLWIENREHVIFFSYNSNNSESKSKMNQGRVSTRIIIRYTILQLPGLALLVLILVFVQGWVDLPAWVFWGSISIWVFKDTILFPFVRRAYDWDRPQGTNSMVGEQGIAKEWLAPWGYVQIRGELWKAELTEGSPPLEKGVRVRVEGTRGLRLVVVQSTIDEECEND
jgi:membrane protein implicated in regulation of membrane protease activity